MKKSSFLKKFTLKKTPTKIVIGVFEYFYDIEKFIFDLVSIVLNNHQNKQ